MQWDRLPPDDFEQLPLCKMVSGFVREGAPIVAEAMDRGAAACFNKAMIVREVTRFVTLIKAVAHGCGASRDCGLNAI
ncbi:hypothetical protein [Sphingobium sp. RAC03]|uniref:hypothetical protein n=1 Tax=Sphingobium sp. RAC03 TaxID=1843368 RepID=UPI0008569814|nr:hypothetical protein [Sphingobium sp. RAC03]AOF96995.1 hypothetical protein BSY17_1240 [Sphingobium sp. RAC03]